MRSKFATISISRPTEIEGLSLAGAVHSLYTPVKARRYLGEPIRQSARNSAFKECLSTVCKRA